MISRICRHGFAPMICLGLCVCTPNLIYALSIYTLCTPPNGSSLANFTAAGPVPVESWILEGRRWLSRDWFSRPGGEAGPQTPIDTIRLRRGQVIQGVQQNADGGWDLIALQGTRQENRLEYSIGYNPLTNETTLVSLTSTLRSEPSARDYASGTGFAGQPDASGDEAPICGSRADVSRAGNETGDTTWDFSEVGDGTPAQDRWETIDSNGPFVFSENVWQIEASLVEEPFASPGDDEWGAAAASSPQNPSFDGAAVNAESNSTAVGAEQTTMTPGNLEWPIVIAPTFLQATPVPEPSARATIAFGVAALLWVRLLRNRYLA